MQPHTLKHTYSPTGGPRTMLPCFFPTLTFSVFSLSHYFSLIFSSLFLCTHLSMRTHRWDVSMGGREAIICIRPSFIPLPLGGTRARGALGWWGCNGSAFANTAAFQTDVCMHTHIHKVVNRRPIISHLFLTLSQLDRRLTIGHWGEQLGVTPAAAHTHTRAHAHTLVIFIFASVSFHPATHFPFSALPLHMILSSFFFSPSFLINWCCLRYYLCHTNQINGRHSFLKGKLLKNVSQSCGFEEDLWSSASLAFFFNMWVFCF